MPRTGSRRHRYGRNGVRRCRTDGHILDSKYPESLVYQMRNGVKTLVGGLAGSDGPCPPGSEKAGSSPMLHVWVVANPCGPFAPMEGIEAGEPPPGETPLCDTAHGST